MHQLRSQLQNFVFTFFFGWLCHFQRWVFSGKLWLKRSFIPSTFSLTSASAAKMWKQASGGGLSLSWLQRFNFEFNQFPVFHLLFDLVFQDFSSLTLIPQFSCFSVFGDFVSIISSVTTSAALPPSFAVLEALQYSLLLCAKVLFRLFYLKAICRGHALFLTILTARKTNLTQPKVRCVRWNVRKVALLVARCTVSDFTLNIVVFAQLFATKLTSHFWGFSV